jgi:hypothetical protein
VCDIEEMLRGDAPWTLAVGNCVDHLASPGRSEKESNMCGKFGTNGIGLQGHSRLIRILSYCEDPRVESGLYQHCNSRHPNKFRANECDELNYSGNANLKQLESLPPTSQDTRSIFLTGQNI